jgi:hypothetical protein
MTESVKMRVKKSAFRIIQTSLGRNHFNIPYQHIGDRAFEQFSAMVMNPSLHSPTRGETMAGLFSRWWAAQHGRQYLILATAFGALMVLFLAGLSQLLFLQNTDPFSEYTGLAIGLVVLSGLGLVVITPEFLVFKGHANTLDEIYEIQSTAELKRRRSDGDRSASALGAGHEERWNTFLQERGLRR